MARDPDAPDAPDAPNATNAPEPGAARPPVDVTAGPEVVGVSTSADPALPEPDDALGVKRAVPVARRMETADSVRDESLLDSDREDVRQTLSEWKAGLTWFWDRAGTPILLAVVAVSIGYTVFNFINYRQQVATEEAWASVAGATSPSVFEQVARDHSLPGARATALLAAGDLYLNEAAAADPAEAGDFLDKAEAQYRAVADGAAHPVFRLNAAEGLGVVAESRLDADAARAQYRALAAQADAAGMPYWRDRAEVRLASLDRLLEAGPLAAVEFAPAPEVVTEAEAEAEPEVKVAEDEDAAAP